MAKTGPKPKPASEKQTKQISVMFTPAEYRAIRQAAGTQPLSGWIRARIREVLEVGPAAEQLGEQSRTVTQLRGELDALREQVQLISQAIGRSGPGRKGGRG